MLIMRWMIRLGVLALAAYGARELYAKYASKADDLREPSREFVQRTKDAVSGAADRVTDATRDLTEEIRDAADDAGSKAAGRLDDNATAADPTPSRMHT